MLLPFSVGLYVAIRLSSGSGLRLISLRVNKDFIYFKKSTLDEFVKRSSNKLFANSQEALQAMQCLKIDYYKNQKNLWKMELPDFKSKKENETKKETIKQPTLTELDDEYHAQQFRQPK